MIKYNIGLLTCLFICLVFHKAEDSLIILPEPNYLADLDKRTMFQVAQLRKDLRLNKVVNPVLENVEEYGPNLSERLCISSICFSGMVKELVIDREDSNIFVMASETGGAWVSYNRGSQWEPIDDDWSGIHLTWVSQDAKDPNIFYFTAGSLGLFVWDKSKSDGLKKWQGTINNEMNSSFDYASYVKNDPNDHDVHYLATQNDIYKRENNSYSLFGQDVFTSSADFEIVPNVGLVSSNVEEITVIKDNGSRSVFNTGIEIPYASEIAYAPSNPNIMYAWCSNVTELKMFKTMDGGDNWSAVPLATTSDIQTHDQTLEIHRYDENRDIILWGAVSMFMAIIDNDHIADPDFKLMLTGHGDYHGTLIHQDTLYEYTDGGIFAYDKNILEPIYNSSSIVAIPFFGVSLSRGLNTLQAVDAVVNPNTEEMAIGLWHNGTWYNKTNGSYTKLNGGDGFESAFHPTNPNLLYTSYQRNGILRWDLNLEEWDDLSLQSFTSPFETKLFVHPNYPEDLFFLDRGLLRLPNASSCISSACDPIRLTGNTIYKDYGFDDSGRINSAYVFNSVIIDKIPSLTDPAGITIYDIRDTEHFDDGNLILDIFVSTTEEVGTLHVLIGGVGPEFIVLKILNNEDDSIEILEKYTITFPENVIPSSLLILRSEDNHCLFGSKYGLFSCPLIDGESAAPVVDIPNVEIRNIRYEEELNNLYFATYGRGIWTANLKASPVSVDELTNGSPSIVAFPNPVSDLLSVTSDKNEIIYILDINGRTVKSETVDKNKKLIINMSNLGSGIYFIKGSISNQTRKIVKS